MTDPDLITRLAREAGFVEDCTEPGRFVTGAYDAGENLTDEIRGLVALVAEACAKIAVGHAGICGICALAHGLSTEEGKLMERAADEASNIAAGIRAKFKEPAQ